MNSPYLHVTFSIVKKEMTLVFAIEYLSHNRVEKRMLRFDVLLIGEFDGCDMGKLCDI